MCRVCVMLCVANCDQPEPGSRISSCPRLSDARASLRVSNTLESQVSKTLNTILRAGKPWHDLHLVAREGCERTQVSLFANSSLKLAILTISILQMLQFHKLLACLGRVEIELASEPQIVCVLEQIDMVRLPYLM
jgi:hypothetical protein